jgi:hypothetical protein
MDELNKNQLILLTLLVSFVTSIATGIITTSLLQEAPPSVTQIINRVVERTIEQVVTNPETGEKVREVTVVVKEEDQVVEAISKNSPGVARITGDALVNGVNVFYGMGFLISKDGIVVSAKTDNINTASTYTAVFGDGARHTLRVAGVDDATNLVFFSVVNDAKAPLKTAPLILSSSELQLGQTVITLDGQEKNAVSIGRVTSVNRVSENNKVVTSIETDINVPPVIVGAPLINLTEEIVGIRTVLNPTGQIFIPINVIKEARSRAVN